MRKPITLVVLCSIVALIAGFALARATRPGSQPAAAPATAPTADVLSQWLGLDAAQARQLASSDAKFTSDYLRLRQEVQARRGELAQAMEDPASSDALIRGKVDAAIEADHAMERRIVEHLLAVRQQLTPEQQQRLFALAADGIRRGGGYCRNLFGPGGPGAGPGRGVGFGQGQGPRRGRMGGRPTGP